MLAKYWKKIGIAILVIACIINVGFKIIKSTPLKKELKFITDVLEENDVYKKEDKDYNSLYEETYGEKINTTNNEL